MYEFSIKNMDIDILDDVANKYNNTNHSLIKIKPVGVTSSTYIDFGIENNDRDSEFKVGDHIKISKPKNIFANGFAPNWF